MAWCTCAAQAMSTPLAVSTPSRLRRNRSNSSRSASGQVLGEQPGVNEVERAAGRGVAGDVAAVDVEVAAWREPADVDVRGDDPSVGHDLAGQPCGDRSGAGADLPTQTVGGRVEFADAAPGEVVEVVLDRGELGESGRLAVAEGVPGAVLGHWSVP